MIDQIRFSNPCMIVDSANYKDLRLVGRFVDETNIDSWEALNKDNVWVPLRSLAFEIPQDLEIAWPGLDKS